MADTIKLVSKVPTNTVASDSDDDYEDKHPKRRKIIEYKVDIT